MEKHLKRVKASCMACALLGLAVLLALPTFSESGEAPTTGQRHVTVRDTIEMTRWADRDYFLGGDPGDRVGIFSPDGREFLIVVRKGSVRRNTNDFSLLLFHTREAFHSPGSQILLTMSSGSNRDAISHVRWLDDGHTITFLGEDSREIPQVFAINLWTRRLTALTHHPTPVLAYDIDGSGDTIVYEASRANHQRTQQSQAGGVVITNESPTDLVAYGCQPGDALGASGAELFVEVKRHPARRVSSEDFVTPAETLSLSPNGHYALVSVYARDIPSWWREYEDPILQGNFSEARRPGVRSNLRRYMVLRTRTRQFTPLVGTPIVGSSAAFAWAKEGDSLVLAGAYLPLDTTDPAERELRKSKRFEIEVRLPKEEIVRITEPAAGTGPPAGTPLAVTLEEDMNTPPKILVSDRAGRRKALLLDLNPQFSQLAFGRVEAVRWKASDGIEFEGGIYLPPDYRPGTRYPLVIQTHGFRQDRFWIDGPWSSAFAAQPLAARGMIVLQVGGSVDPAVEVTRAETPEEAPVEMAAYEGAVDELDRRGLIDRDRVGIIGFSRTVYYVEYALTHSKYRFQAASLADGFDGGYVNYMLWPLEDYLRVNGGRAFGSSLTTWLESSPGFHLDRVATPVHLEYYGRAGFLGGWQWYSGLSLLGKPVDYMWIPDGTHLLVKPSERTASQQGTVDWFAFWLLGEEAPDPAMKDRYHQWQRLRALGDREAKPGEPSVTR